MKKIWYLSTCSTCLRIIDELKISNDEFEMFDLKNNPIKVFDLDLIKKYNDSTYGDLFNKRALKYKLVKDKIISEEDYKNAILTEYTFLKRPIILIKEKVFVGNSRKVIEDCKNYL